MEYLPTLNLLGDPCCGLMAVSKKAFIISPGTKVYPAYFSQYPQTRLPMKGKLNRICGLFPAITPKNMAYSLENWRCHALFCRRISKWLVRSSFMSGRKGSLREVWNACDGLDAGCLQPSSPGSAASFLADTLSPQIPQWSMLNETSSLKYLDRGWGIKKTRVHTLWVHEYGTCSSCIAPGKMRKSRSGMGIILRAPKPVK